MNNTWPLPLRLSQATEKMSCKLEEKKKEWAIYRRENSKWPRRYEVSVENKLKAQWDTMSHPLNYEKIKYLATPNDGKHMEPWELLCIVSWIKLEHHLGKQLGSI